MLSIIADYLQDTLFEHAFKRKQILIKVSNLYEQIAINLIKIAVFCQESTWKDEFETYIDKISRIKRKEYKIKIPAKKYYDELFEYPFEPVKPWNESYVYKLSISKEILKNEKYIKLYHLPINEQNVTLIHEKIKELIRNISNLLSERFFDDGRFEELSNEYVEFWIQYSKNLK